MPPLPIHLESAQSGEVQDESNARARGDQQHCAWPVEKNNINRCFSASACGCQASKSVHEARRVVRYDDGHMEFPFRRVSVTAAVRLTTAAPGDTRRCGGGGGVPNVVISQTKTSQEDSRDPDARPRSDDSHKVRAWSAPHRGTCTPNASSIPGLAPRPTKPFVEMEFATEERTWMDFSGSPVEAQAQGRREWAERTQSPPRGQPRSHSGANKRGHIEFVACNIHRCDGAVETSAVGLM
ncbi:hypothetical protein HDK64DRAFT_115852 [Phyllosticta capitalensis]